MFLVYETEMERLGMQYAGSEYAVPPLSFFKGGGCCLFINDMIYNMYGEHKKLDGCFHVLFLFCILFLIPS